MLGVGMDKLNIPEAQLTTNSLVENQLMFKNDV